MQIDQDVVSVRPAATGDAAWCRDSLARVWGSVHVARRGELLDASALPTLIADVGGRPIGMLTYAARGDDWEVVSIHSDMAGRGCGRALLTAAEHLASAAGAQRIWLITTNNNVGALRFYQRCGYNLVRLYPDAVTASRATLKPEIPMEVDGIPLRHELELERLLPRH